MTLNDASKTMIQHVDASTYAAQAGMDLKRPISTLAADDLVFTNRGIDRIYLQASEVAAAVSANTID